MITFDLKDLADLTADPAVRATLGYPWHSEALGRDVITNGMAALSWDGHQFAERPSSVAPPDAAMSELFEERPLIGTTSINQLREWSEPSFGHCDICWSRVYPRCCGRLALPDSPGRLGKAIVNRALIERFTRPLIVTRDPVAIRGDDSPLDPIQFVGKGWTLVVMPMAEHTTAIGTPFEFSGARNGAQGDPGTVVSAHETPGAGDVQ